MAKLSDKNKSLTFIPAPQSPDSAGFITESADDVVPTGWLECNGQAVSRTEYSELFALIGTTYGAGDGSTTFNLPGGSQLNNAQVTGTLNVSSTTTLSEDLIVDTDTLFVDSTNDRVGIGTTTPAELLEVRENSTAEGRIRLSNLEGHFEIATDANIGFLGTSGFLDTLTVRDGKIGIGNTNPSTKLAISNTAADGVETTLSASGSLGIWEGRGVSGNADTARLGVGKNNTTLIYTNSPGTPRTAFAIGTSDTTPLVFSSNNTERVRIDSAGRVGINGAPSTSSTLDFKLDVEGNINGKKLFSSDVSGGGTSFLTSIRIGTQAGAYGAGHLIKVSGTGFSSGVAFSALYHVATRVNGGAAPDIASTLISTVGLGGPGVTVTCTFSNDGGFLRVNTSASVKCKISVIN